MYGMFSVRSAHALAPPSLHSQALSPCMPLVRCRRPTPSRLRPTPRLASYALLSTRQHARAFNQPLSFDTSSVTTMYYTFYVRSAHALPLTRQVAKNFNQPLSFDTSSVTDMQYMFFVRSLRVHPAPSPPQS